MNRGVEVRRGAVLLALCAGLAGCVAPAGDGLYYAPPTASGVQAVATERSAAEVAQILQKAGLGTVRVQGDVVTLRSRDARLVDCGTYVQVAMGNRAEFPGTSEEAVLMEGFETPGLIQRKVETQSTVRLTRQADGQGYAVSESHTVTSSYTALETGARSTRKVAFDGVSDGVFPNSITCRSSGLVAGLLR